jgi:hypothetical protein
LKKLFPVLDEHEIIEVLEVRISPTLTWNSINDNNNKFSKSLKHSLFETKITVFNSVLTRFNPS